MLELADQGHYPASESSFYRILAQMGNSSTVAGPIRRSGARPPASDKASAPCEVWIWE